MSLPKENWKPVVGYEQLYLVSDTGQVFSLRSQKALSPKTARHGYLRVGLSAFGKCHYFSIHRLVAEAFIPNPEGKPTVNHLNEIKSDNRVENLEWATHREQNLHGTRSARAVANTDWEARSAKMNYSEIAKKHSYETMNADQMRRVRQLDLAGNLIAVFDSIGQAARNVQSSTAHIWECCNGKRKTCKGSVWQYA